MADRLTLNGSASVLRSAERKRGAFGVRAADALRFAAAPTFAAMAVLTALFSGDPSAAICGGVAGAPALSGMVAMYMLMSAFHLTPWLKLLSRRRATK